MTMNTNLKRKRTIKEKKIFYELSSAEELLIKEEYEEQGRTIIGWETIFMGSLAVFKLYLA